MGMRLKILILEDNDTDAQMILRILNKSNRSYQFNTVMNKEAYVLALDNYHPDVILSDNSLPQFNATEALQLLRQRNSLIPFIMVTGTVSEEYAADIIKSGADDFILKDRMARLPVAIDAALKQRQTEKEKRHAEEMNSFKAGLLNTIGQAVIATDLHGIISYWNKAAEKMYGWSAEEARSKNVTGLIPSQQTPQEIIDSMKELLLGHSWSGELVVQRKDGHSLPVFINKAPVFDVQQHVSGIIEISSDITKRKKAEEEVKDLNEQLRNLSAHLQNIREEERIQIANDLHDELGQQLTGLKMELSMLIKKLSGEDPALREQALEIVSQMDTIVRSVRRISSNLRPSILDDLGLIAALEWHSSEVEKRSGIRVHFTSNVKELQIPVSTSTELFRIYQEVLTNAERHSKGHEVLSNLNMSDNQLVLEIKDDGQGINPSVKNNKKTLGLISIKERTFILGGQYELNSETSKGTQVKITIPL
jgi:two-component system, NarL family, sensor histidine kinase UhpB